MTTIAALTTLYTTRKEAITQQLAYRYGCNPADVEDAVQDVFLRLLAVPEKWRRKSLRDLESFLFLAVEQQLQRTYRAQRKRRDREVRYATGDMSSL